MEGGIIRYSAVLVIALCFLLLTPLVHSSLAWGQVPATSDVGNVKEEFIQLYIEVAELGKEGINVTSLVHELSKALKLINEGTNESLIRAESILSRVRSELESLKAEAPRIILANNVRKYGAVTALASVPVVFYFLLPRVYLAIWFRVRRRWVVES